MIRFSQLKEKALEVGFDDVGVTKAVIPDSDQKAYRQWIAKNHQGPLAYMENEMRCDPKSLFPGARYALMFVSYYRQAPLPFKKDAGLIASYARGRDYHNIHRSRLKKIIRYLEVVSKKKHIARGFSDSAPLLEKALAVQAGLGWFGKNTLLIHRRFGTFTLLSGLLTSLDVEEQKKPFPVCKLRMQRCGPCTLCLDACPTQALVAPYLLDANKCLSTHLIESKEKIPESIARKNPGYLFGCDICQDVCPHNQRKPPTENRDFQVREDIAPYLNQEQLQMLEKHPEKLYGSPLKRKGIIGLQENLEETIKKFK